MTTSRLIVNGTIKAFSPFKMVKKKIPLNVDNK